jgi:hypothetical protein
MKALRRWTLLAMLIAGAWLPVTLTCDPAGGVLHVAGDWVNEVVVVDDGYYDDGCCGYWDDWGGGFDFDFFGHHHDDD